MDRVVRLAFYATLFGLFLVGAPALSVVLPEEFVPNPRELVRWLGVLHDEAARNRALIQELQDVRRVMEEKRAVCRDLIAGRCDLNEAARRFDVLAGPDAEAWKYTLSKYAGADDEERLRRHVLESACEMLQDEPEQAAALRRRLEWELTTESAATRGSAFAG
jgi:hypothetical protein